MMGCVRLAGLLFPLLIFQLLTVNASAATGPGSIPDTLAPWRDWVLEKHTDLDCPRHYARLDEHLCGWPGPLQMDVRESGAEFQQAWFLFSPGWLVLPGDQRNWPRGVQVNDRAATVVERDGKPAVWLAAGEYQIRGSFFWDSRPSRLGLPLSTALVTLVQDGVSQLANLEANGDLLLGKTRSADVAADSLDVQVFRKLTDGVPLEMHTEIRVAVSGKEREIRLGRLLLEGMEILSLDSPLPARIEPDGQLRMQVRTGEWTVQARARVTGQPSTFTPQKQTPEWPDEEVWVFQENPMLRQVSVNAPSTIDPAQTELPAAWRQLPAFLVRDGDALNLTEQQRGDTSPAADNLALVRQIWLDFDGSGYTFRDHLTGGISRAMRLSMAGGYQPGRADVNGEPQLITRLGTSEKVGLEVRQGSIDLLAISRFDGISLPLSASGWQQDMASVSASLYTPPGWQLLHAVGSDFARGAWLSQWNLWGIFLVLIIAATSFRQWGLAAGSLALVMLVLTYHTQGAPVFIWLNILVVLALLRALPAGRLHTLLGWYLRGCFLVLIVFVLQFTVAQVRLALYPQLELPWQIQHVNPVAYGSESDAGMREDSASPALAKSVELADKHELARENRAVYPQSIAAAAAPEPKRKLKTGYDPDARIQTGPGEPAWQWQQIELRWSGPVTADQTMHLVWLSPALHSVWRLLSVVLVLAYAGGMLRAGLGVLGRASPAPVAAAGVVPVNVLLVGLVLTGLLASSPTRAADFPSPELLAEFEQRLLKAPDCEPSCVAINDGTLQINEQGLLVKLRLDVAARVAVPLPVRLSQWQPKAVRVDGAASKALRREEDVLWLALPEGQHQIEIEGPVTADSLQLPFSLGAHNLSVSAQGWTVAGLVEGRVPSGTLELRREERNAVEGQAAQLLPDPAPVFALLTRRITLGMDWQIETRVERLAPAEGAILLAVPLLPGESVLSNGVRVKDGQVQVSIGRESSLFSWRSSLKQAAGLTLQAPTDQPWVEQWVFAVSPLWNVRFEGLAPVKQAVGTNSEPMWRPWPGESLELVVERPEAVEGPTRTIESVKLSYVPGARAGDVTLAFSVRSSRGGEWVMPLPPGVVLQRLSIDGVEQSNPPKDSRLRVSLRPGVQQIQVQWRQPDGVMWRDSTPALVLGESSSNIDLSIQVPEGRWLLLAGGPAMGPAVLVWGVLLVMVLVALGLGRSGLTPVKTWQWCLLGLGMSTVNSVGSILVVLWFCVMAKRATVSTTALTRAQFNLMQVVMVLLTLAAWGCLLGTIPMSLLSSPDMQVTGNGSTATLLQWYQDRATVELPQAWFISVPMWVYRSVMLCWSLWLVFALIGWCRWGWNCFSSQGLWRSLTPPEKPVHKPE